MFFLGAQHDVSARLPYSTLTCLSGFLVHLVCICSSIITARHLGRLWIGTGGTDLLVKHKELDAAVPGSKFESMSGCFAASTPTATGNPR